LPPNKMAPLPQLQPPRPKTPVAALRPNAGQTKTIRVSGLETRGGGKHRGWGHLHRNLSQRLFVCCPQYCASQTMARRSSIFRHTSQRPVDLRSRYLTSSRLDRYWKRNFHVTRPPTTFAEAPIPLPAGAHETNNSLQGIHGSLPDQHYLLVLLSIGGGLDKRGSRHHCNSTPGQNFRRSPTGPVRSRTSPEASHRPRWLLFGYTHRFKRPLSWDSAHSRELPVICATKQRLASSGAPPFTPVGFAAEQRDNPSRWVAYHTSSVLLRPYVDAAIVAY
ncbi:hypothetical protein L249_4075, partial [Ophiocordyceps polyrhachis-furcata BCC 54312]